MERKAGERRLTRRHSTFNPQHLSQYPAEDPYEAKPLGPAKHVGNEDFLPKVIGFE
jgi:hypothetical protein